MKYKRLLLTCVLIFFGLLTGHLLYQFGSVSALFAWLGGDSVYIEKKTVNLGSCNPETNVMILFPIRNLRSHEVTIIGSKSSCSCAFSEGYPVVIKPAETRKLKIRVKFDNHQKSYEETVIFMISDRNVLTLHPVKILAVISKQSSTTF